MAKFFLSTWDWLKDADNRALLGWIGGGIAALATAIWVVYTHFASTKQGGSQPNGWIEYGIRAGGDIRASGDIIQGLSPVQVQKIIATFNTAEVERISEELGVAKAAVLNFFRIIGQQNALITVEEFDAKLCEIALRHKAFQAEIATIQPDDPVVLEAKNKAATAAEQGDYNLAEKFLQDALSRDLTAAQQLSVVTDKRLISAAKTRGELGLLKLAELRFSDAAEDFLEAADLVPTTYPILHSEYINSPHYQERCHPSQSQTRGLDGAQQCVVTARRSRLMSEGG